MITVIYIIFGLIILGLGYFITVFVFDLLLRGFLPFLPSRPWVVEQIMNELELPPRDRYLFIAFSTGRSGFFHALEKKYPQAKLIGVESSLFPYLVSKMQSWIKPTRIKVIRQPVHRAPVKQADFIYSHLYPDAMAGLGKKLKFECKPNTVVVSTGFNIPDLDPVKVIDLPDRKGRFDFLSKNQKLFQRKSKRYRKEKKAYFYII